MRTKHCAEICTTSLDFNKISVTVSIVNTTIVSTTAQQVSHLPSRLTPEIGEYLGKVRMTAQATYDRWPEANGMRRELWALAGKAGISSEQVVFDLAYTPIECDGGRW